MERIYVSEPTLGEAELLNVESCIRSGRLTYGRFVDEFQERFAASCKCAHGIATTSGTTALHLVLASLGIGPGDEVIVPNLTFVATANAVRYCGANVVLVDVDEATWNIDPQKVLAAISPRTRAIIAVHLYGLPANMYALRTIVDCCKQKIHLIEDAAEAIGGTIYPDIPVGSLASDAAVFSFYGNKTITTGEGGMIVTNSHALRDRMYYLRGQAQSSDVRYYHDEIGFNYRMTDIQAAIGCAQLDKLSYLIERRQQVWFRYAMQFRKDQRQRSDCYTTHAAWMFVVLFKDNKERSIAEQELERANVETRPVFVPLSLLPEYRKPAGDFQNSFSIRNRGLCLPTHANLKDEDVDRIVTIVKEVMS
jgi:perosamine synthetase